MRIQADDHPGAMSLERRLRALEGGAGGQRCETCGRIDGEPWSKLERGIEVEWHDDPEDDVPEEEFCEECGVQLSYIITWGDD